MPVCYHPGRMRFLLRLAIALALLYGLAVAVLYSYMRRPPEEFTQFMARVPPPAMRALPFRSLWFSARAGTLRPGDPAPDFELDTFDRNGRFRLSSLRGSLPVVLVFGSYT